VGDSGNAGKSSGGMSKKSQAFIMVAVVCGVAAGMLGYSPLPDISSPIKLGFAIVVVIVAIVVIQRNKRKERNSTADKPEK
jgi:uncharacterized membrane protein YfcA